MQNFSLYSYMKFNRIVIEAMPVKESRTYKVEGRGNAMPKLWL